MPSNHIHCEFDKHLFLGAFISCKGCKALQAQVLQLEQEVKDLKLNKQASVSNESAVVPPGFFSK